MIPGHSPLVSTATQTDPARQPVIIAALRSPVCRANGQLKHLRAPDLLAPVLASLLESTAVEPSDVDDVIIGNAVGGVETSPGTPRSRPACLSPSRG